MFASGNRCSSSFMIFRIGIRTSNGVFPGAERARSVRMLRLLTSLPENCDSAFVNSTRYCVEVPRDLSLQQNVCVEEADARPSSRPQHAELDKVLQFFGRYSKNSTCLFELQFHTVHCFTFTI